MAAGKIVKASVEALLVSVEIGGLKLRPRVVKTRRLVTVEMLWPRPAIARKSSARELVFRKALADVSGEPWSRRMLLREDVEGHCGFGVTVSEVLDDEWIEKFMRATAKYALREFSSVIQQYTAGISDIAAAPMDALAQLEGTYPGPKTALQGVIDFTDAMMPAKGGSCVVTVPLSKPGSEKVQGSLKLEVRRLQ
jgi:hypothetical protein